MTESGAHNDANIDAHKAMDAPHDGIDAALDAALSRFAAQPRVLLALDFDGVLAPEVDAPDDARALASSHQALAHLHTLPDTTVALISGRSLVSLTHVAMMPNDIPLVGSHGLEARLAPENERPVVTAHDASRVTALRSALEAHVDAVEGAFIEDKPAGLAVHTRTAANGEDARALDVLVREVASQLDAGLTVRTGKNVVEFSVRDATKGDGVELLREQFAPDAVLFAGDDVTDEDALRVLRPGDVGIKVGAAETVAEFRVADEAAVARVLAVVLERRLEALAATS